jgi:hypothetical protein
MERGHSRPYLVDWDRDGHMDLVLGCVGSWTLDVCLGPLADKKDFKSTKPANLTPIPEASPIHFAFTDWDRDGRMDLLVAVEWGRFAVRPPKRYSVYWYRNISDTGPPNFAAPAHLLDIPEPWELHSLTAVDRGQAGRPGLVVSVSKGWKRDGNQGSWPVASELWLYRQKAEAGSPVVPSLARP